MPDQFEAPHTPDFARYDWRGLNTAKVIDDWVRCRWNDGTEHRFYGLWLWENTVGCGIDPTTRESTVDPADLPVEPVVATAEVSGDGGLAIEWWSGDRSAIHPGWLRTVGDRQHTPTATLPPTRPWPVDEWRHRSDGHPAADGRRRVDPPTFEGSSVLDDGTVLEEWLEAAVVFGLSRLVGVGTDPDFLDHLADRIGPIRATNFGRLFSVRSIVSPTAEENSVANTGLMLGQHTDLPSRETPPGFQMLHCIANTVGGGWAAMTDGAALVERLRTAAPEDFDVLTEQRWVFANRSPDADHRWSSPMIELAESGRPLTLRCFYPVRAYPDMADENLPRAYAAMRRFSEMSRDPAFTIEFPYAPGDLVAFDNRRVLHGRARFDPSAGERHLRGCYFDSDDVYSRLRVLRRRRRETR